jgi:hypothetical protein
LDLWYKIVVDYSGRSLTFESDKLPAISGIAAKMKKLLGTSYVAGVWADDLYGLMWHRKQVCTNNGSGDAEIMRVPRHYRAPSWSWASGDESVEFMRGSGPDRSTLILLASVVHSNIIVSDERDTWSGIKKRSSITLNGFFYEPRVSSSSLPEIGRFFFDYRCEKSMSKKIFYFVVGLRSGPRQVNRKPYHWPWANRHIVDIDRHTPSKQELAGPHELFGLLLTSPEEGVFERVGIFETAHKLPRKALARSRRSAPTYKFKATFVDGEQRNK